MVDLIYASTGSELHVYDQRMLCRDCVDAEQNDLMQHIFLPLEIYIFFFFFFFYFTR